MTRRDFLKLAVASVAALALEAPTRAAALAAPRPTPRHDYIWKVALLGCGVVARHARLKLWRGSVPLLELGTNEFGGVTYCDLRAEPFVWTPDVRVELTGVDVLGTVARRDGAVVYAPGGHRCAYAWADGVTFVEY